MKTTLVTIANAMVVLTLITAAVSIVSPASTAEASIYCEEGQLNLSPCLPKPTAPQIEVPKVDVPQLTVPKLTDYCDENELNLSPCLPNPTPVIPAPEPPVVNPPSVNPPEYCKEDELNLSPCLPRPEPPVVHPPTVNTCELTANQNVVAFGGNVTINWSVSGFTQVKINGETVSGNSGSKVYSNITERTVFVLEATDGKGSNCVQRVVVDCELPPVDKECRLKLNKLVDKSAAQPGDLLTYTITIENIGTGKCSGSGVKIEDKLDPNIEYVSHTLSNNILPGYVNYPVRGANRTLYFNGDTLTPGEKGTITWVGQVKTPNQCGDFVVKNQARATALELNNYNNWAYSQTVHTTIDNDCVVVKTPECTLTPVIQSIENGDRATLSWTTKNVETVTITEFGVVMPNGSQLTAPLFVNKTYVLTAKGYGKEVECKSDVKVGSPSEKFAKVVAHKIVCTDESQLPNYGLGGPNITANTAQNWVDANSSCSFASGWEFEWTNNQTNDPGDTLVGKAGSPWMTFGPTNSNGRTETSINLNSLTDSRIWLREVLQTDYIPFSFGPNGENNNNAVSAEFYCDTDVNNYDNRDFISGMQDNSTYYCVAWNSPVPDVPAPSCDLFEANPTTIVRGQTAELRWESTNAVQAFLTGGFGSVEVNGTRNVTPDQDTTYRLTLIGAEDQAVDCEKTVKVIDKVVPICEDFTATPNQLGVGGGEATLDWKVVNATKVVIAPNVGDVDANGSRKVNVTESVTYTLTATDNDGNEDSCIAPIAVADPEAPFTCANNVTFRSDDTSIRRGQSATLSWTTIDVDSVSFDGINSTALNGSETVSPSRDTTYTLKATQGNETINCPVSIDVSSGGGGGSSSPRCDLDISDRTIDLGDEITLSWDTSNVSEVILKDDSGKVLFTTEDYLSDEKSDYFDSSIKLKPKRNTTYTLTAERGSRDVDCSVEVELEDSVVVLQSRDQQPLVAGISLSQVPYTGFEAGPVMTVLFYLLLVAWALYITYLIILRKQSVVMEDAPIMDMPALTDRNHEFMKKAEASRPDAFVASVSVDAPVKTVPSNLPVAEAVVGYESLVSQVNESLAAELENRAHTQKALLSSDAVLYFINTTEGTVERNEALDQVIAEAKNNYPLEDGWIVINEDRMRNLCEACALHGEGATQVASTMATEKGTSSLAEAIVTGNVMAAYEMIGNRPMFALADAAADLDSVYRMRKGESVLISDLLKKETASLTNEQIKNMITALTGALDGTYSDESSAVKMAIMKAVKEVA